MKTYNKSYLPDVIEYNGQTYKRNTTLSLLRFTGKTELGFMNEMKAKGKRVIACNVMSKNSKGTLKNFNQLETI
jgi:hypothetical protein